MAATKPKKPKDGSWTKHGKSTSKSDASLPDAAVEDPRGMRARRSGSKDMLRETLSIAAATRRGGSGAVAGRRGPIHHMAGRRGCAATDPRVSRTGQS